MAQEVKQLSLSEAVNLGIQNSKNLKLTQARVEEALAKYNKAIIYKLPSGSVSYTGNHAEIPTHTFQPSPENRENIA